MNAILSFVLIIGLILFGFDLVTRTAGLGFNAQYRRVLRMVSTFFHRHTSRLIHWAWREYKQFIIGAAVGGIVTLYLTGHFG